MPTTLGCYRQNLTNVESCMKENLSFDSNYNKDDRMRRIGLLLYSGTAFVLYFFKYSMILSTQ
jgi:hypothetical protein